MPENFPPVDEQADQHRDLPQDAPVEPSIYGSYDEMTDLGDPVDAEVVEDVPPTGSEVAVYDPVVAAKAGYKDGMLDAEVVSEEVIAPPAAESQHSREHEAAISLAALKVILEVMKQSPAERYMHGLRKIEEVDAGLASLVAKNNAVMEAAKAENAAEQPEEQAEPENEPVFSGQESYVAAVVLEHAQAALKQHQEEYRWRVTVEPQDLFDSQRQAVETAILNDPSIEGTPEERSALLESVYGKMPDALKTTVDQNVDEAHRQKYDLAA